MGVEAEDSGGGFTGDFGVRADGGDACEGVAGVELGELRDGGGAVALERAEGVEHFERFGGFEECVEGGGGEGVVVQQVGEVEGGVDVLADECEEVGWGEEGVDGGGVLGVMLRLH